MGKRKKTHEFEDQFGEHRAQDREEHFGFSKGGGGGGGTAGKSKPGNTNLNFQRQLPKFLQPYAHMLGQKKQDEDEPQILMEQQLRAQQDDDEEDDTAEEEAIQRALEENPELVEQLGEEYMKKVAASKEKELGNTAFAAKDYETAIKHFTKCIELDAKNAVYYSNRSAAAANLSRFDDALDDAKMVLKLKPGWVKGYARAAAAYMGLQLYSEAKEVYEKAVKLEPDDQALQRGLDKATGMELQHMRDRKHVFKKVKPSGSSASQQQQKQKQQHATGSNAAAGAAAGAGSKPKQKAKLSFAMDDEEEEQ